MICFCGREHKTRWCTACLFRYRHRAHADYIVEDDAVLACTMCNECVYAGRARAEICSVCGAAIVEDACSVCRLPVVYYREGGSS